MRTIASSKFAIANHGATRRLQIVGQTEQGAEVDKNGSRVQHPAEFAGRVIPWESVVVVVKSFADRSQDGGQTFGRTDALVVRMTAPQMGGRIHQPGHVQRETVAEQGARVKCQVGRLAPEVDWNERRQNETGHQHGPQVVSRLAKKMKFD